MNSRLSYSNLPAFLPAIAVAAAYYISARMGLMFAFEKSNATPVWPPSGIAFAAFLLLGNRTWWGVTLGAFAVNLVVFLLNNAASWQTALWVSAAISAGNTLEAGAGYWLIKRFAANRGYFETTPQILNFVLTGLLMCLVGSAIGPLAVTFGKIIQWEQLPSVWLNWWLGDVTGIFLLTPFIIFWLGRKEKTPVYYDWKKAIEAVCLLVVLFTIGGMIFNNFFSPSFAFDRAYLVIPVLLWAALRFDFREVVTVSIITSALAVWGAIHGNGPFQHSSMNATLLSVQGFVAIISITFLTLKAALYERKKAEAEIREAHGELEALTKTQAGKLFSSQKEIEDYRERIDQLLGVLLKTTQLDFSRRAEVSARGDELDAIAAGLNVMSEEFEFHLKKLRESEEKFKGLLENAPDAVVIVDKNGIIQLVNAQTEKMFGFLQDELVGKKVEMLIPHRFQLIHPRYREMFFENPKFRGMGVGLDLFGKRKSGEEFPVEISLSPMRTSDGMLVSAAIRDITFRKMSEEKIRYQASLIENIADAAISTDHNFTIQSWNNGAEALYGWKAEEVMGKPLPNVLRSEIFNNGTKEKAFEELRKKGNYRGEDKQFTKEGKPVNVIAAVNGLRNEKGEIVGMVAINRDITLQKDTEQKIKESEEKFNKAFQASPAGISLARLSDQEIIDVNESFLKIFGYSRKEIIGQSLAGIGIIVNKEMQDKILEPVLQSGSEKNIEMELKHKSGKTVNVLVSVDSVLIKNEKHIIAVINDITGKKQAEQQIRENQIFIGHLTEASPDFIGVQDIVEKKVVYANNKARRFHGFSEDEPFDLKKVWAAIHPDDLPRITAYAEKYKTMKDQEVQEIEFRIKGQDGKWCWMLSSSMVIRRNEKGEPKYILSISRDITRRKEAEERLKESEEQIQTIFQNAPEAVILIDEESIIREWNPFAEKIFGWEKEEVTGKYLYDIIIPQRFRSAHIEGLKNYLRTGEGTILNHPLELSALRKDNSEFDAGINISPLVFRGRKFFIGFVTDISPRKKAENELRKKSEELLSSNNELERFAYVASHDLQEPLRMVSSYVQLLERRYKDKLDDDANDFIHFAVDGSNRMRKLINSLLEYSRVNRVKPFENIKTNQMLEEVLFDLREVVEESKAVIKIEKLPGIYGDPVLIAQLFQNLIGNAIKFRSDKTPEIVISGKSSNGDVLFSVKDNGIGIKPEYFNKIFVIFQRLHPQEKYPGTGIGLAICKKIVERHEGRIWVESEEGMGSTFYFTIKKMNKVSANVNSNNHLA